MLCWFRSVRVSDRRPSSGRDTAWEARYRRLRRSDDPRMSLNLRRVEGGVQARRHFQTSSGLGGADKLQGLLVTVQRLGCPVAADLAEQTMLDGIPFGGAGRIVGDSDAESQTIA